MSTTLTLALPLVLESMGDIPLTALTIDSMVIDSTVQQIADMFEISVKGSQVYQNRVRLGLVDLSSGMLDALGNAQLVKHITSGRILEYEIRGEADKLTGMVRGRDAASFITDTTLYITYGARFLGTGQGNVSPQGVFTQNQLSKLQRSFLGSFLPNLPGITYRLFLGGWWSAKMICEDLCQRVSKLYGVTINCNYQAPDYFLRTEFEVSGPIHSAIQELVAPFSQLEPSKVDIWMDGTTLNIRSRPGLAESPAPGVPLPSPINVINVTDARLQNYMVRASFLDYIRLVRLTGARSQTGTACSSLITQTSDDEIFDQEGNLVQKIIETTTIRKPDNANLSSVRETYDGGTNLVERTTTSNQWDDFIFGQNCEVLNTPVQRFQTVETEKLDDSGILRGFQRQKIRFVYDDAGFLHGQETVTSVFDAGQGAYIDQQVENKTFQDNGALGFRVTTTVSSIDPTTGAQTLQSQRTDPGSGFRPAGPGGFPQGRTMAEPNGPPSIFVALVDNQPGAKDLTYDNPNLIALPLTTKESLTNVFLNGGRGAGLVYPGPNPGLLSGTLNLIYQQAVQASGAWEYEISFTVLNMPWLRRGQMVFFTGLFDENGKALPLQAAFISELKIEYDENSTYQLVTSGKALYWSKQF